MEENGLKITLLPSIFAKYSVALLNKLYVDVLCFGSERENIEDIKKAARYQVEDINFDIITKKYLNEGDILAIVGESGSGKSVTMKSVMGLLGENADVQADHLELLQKDLLSMSEKEKRKMRGKDMAGKFLAGVAANLWKNYQRKRKTHR